MKKTIIVVIVCFLMMFATYILYLFASDSLVTLAMDMLYYPSWRIALLRIAVGIIWGFGFCLFLAWILEKSDKKGDSK